MSYNLQSANLRLASRFGVHPTIQPMVVQVSGRVGWAINLSDTHQTDEFCNKAASQHQVFPIGFAGD